MKPLKVPEKIRHLYGSHPATISFLAAVIVLSLDYITGKHIEFPIMYAIPVGLAAWKKRRGSYLLLAITLPLVRILFHFAWVETSMLRLVALNSPITIAALLFYGLLIERTSVQTEKLETKVEMLEGILPICASCKRIRNTDGTYEQIEQYITERSDTHFTHTICPDCAEKLYPDFYTKKDSHR